MELVFIALAIYGAGSLLFTLFWAVCGWFARRQDQAIHEETRW